MAVVIEGEKTEPSKYKYEARTVDGKVVKGIAKAMNEIQVSEELYSRGQVPLKITDADSGFAKDFSISGRKTVKLKSLALMSRQFAASINAGIPIVSVLDMLATQTDDAVLVDSLKRVRTDVENGMSLADAMAKQESVYPPMMINMVAAGELGGFLDKSLEYVADSLESQVKLKSQIKGAMAYPTVVFFLAIIIAIGMIWFLVPVFAEMYSGLGAELPAITQFLMTLSEKMSIIVPISIVLVIIAAIWWGRNKNKRSVREVVDPLKLKIPGFGALFHKIALARFCRNLSLLSSSGVPILQALEMTAQTIGNVQMEEAVMKSREAVSEGRSIADPLRSEPLFPNMVVQMVAVGEENGDISTLLEKAATFYEQEIETTTKSLQSLVEPLMMIVIGVIVGFIVLSMFLPYVSIGDALLKS